MFQNASFVYGKKYVNSLKIYNYLTLNYKSIYHFINDDIWFYIFSFINTDITSNFLINICMTNKKFNNIINERIKPIYAQFSIISFWRSKPIIKQSSGLKNGDTVFYNDGDNKCLAIVIQITSTTKAKILPLEDIKLMRAGGVINTYRRHMVIIHASK